MQKDSCIYSPDDSVRNDIEGRVRGARNKQIHQVNATGKSDVVSDVVRRRNVS